MSDIELKPCPFCGNQPELHSSMLDRPDFAMAMVICRKCGATSNRHRKTIEEAVTHWNTRTPNFKNSSEMIEAATQCFKDLEHKGWDWRSFYNGFLEGATR